MRRILIVILGAGIGLTLALALWPQQDASPEVSEPIGLTAAPSEGAVVANESPASSRASGVDQAIRSTVESTDHGDVFVVAFPDGELIRVQKHRPVLPPMIRSAERLADVYASVRGRAEAGDMDAALALGEALRTCRNVAPSQKALDAAIDEFYQTRQFGRFDSDIKVQVDPSVEMDQLEGSMRSQFAYCDGITAAQIAEADQWTEQAAELGSHLAKQRVLSDNSANARGFGIAQELWQSGNIHALGSLARFYDSTHGGTVVEPDNVTAYAYYYLSTQFDIADTPEIHEFKAQWDREALESLGEKGNALSPLELASALELAKQMLRENKNCCVSW